MDLYVHFPKYPDKDYCITSGATFKQNYNETLDSGSIRIDHVLSKLPIKPYDDVIVYSGTLRKKSSLTEVIQGDNFRDSQTGSFYAHFLVGDVNRQLLSLPNSKKAYNYTGSLMSETKGLEKVPLPNIAITQPRNGTFITIGHVISNLVEQFSPKLKRATNSALNTSPWELSRKYVVNPNDECWADIWDAECPEHSFANPTLRDVLNFVVSTKDRIIVVHDWVIRCIDITKRNQPLGDFESSANNGVSTWMMSAGDYCDRLRTEYSDGLASKTTTHYTEKLGFRNSDSAIMTLQNMRLEFSHPIYRIKRIFMCYYRNCATTKNGVPDYINPKYRLVKRDITPLVLLNSKRDLLSENWHDANILTETTPPASLDEIAKYRLCTIGYDIGSKYITGWGQVYSYPSGFFKASRSYIENIVSLVAWVEYINDVNGTLGPYSDYDQGEGKQYVSPRSQDAIKIAYEEVNRIAYTGASQFSDDDVTEDMENFFLQLRTVFGQSEQTVPLADSFLPNSYALRLKSIFFECEYEGFVDGAVTVSKDYHDGDVVSIDSQGQPLAITESDGIAKKEKANRLGNATLTVPKRHYSLSQVHGLGDYDDDDQIIFMSSITVFKDYIAAQYYLCKDYVLKNYFTSVISKHRPFALMDYSESVVRKENRTIEILLSGSESYSHVQNAFMPFYVSKNSVEDLTDLEISEMVISFFKEMEFDYHTNTFITDGGLDVSSVSTAGSDNILTDTQVYNFGYSMCINVAMEYNIKSKAWLSRFRPNFWNSMYDKISAFFGNINQAEDFLDTITGSFQSYYMVPLDESTQETEYLRFSAFAIPYDYTNSIFKDDGSDISLEDLCANMDNMLLQYPKISASYLSQSTIQFRSTVVLKDQKERVSMTMQYEPISESEDIQFSEYFMLLSDIYKQLPKTKSDIFYNDNSKLVVAFGTNITSTNEDALHNFFYGNPLVIIGINDDYSEQSFTYDLTDNPIEYTWNSEIVNPRYHGPGEGTFSDTYYYKIKAYVTRIERDAVNDTITITATFERYVADGEGSHTDITITQTATAVSNPNLLLGARYKTFVFNSGINSMKADFTSGKFGYTQGENFFYYFYAYSANVRGLVYIPPLYTNISADFTIGCCHIVDLPDQIASDVATVVPKNLFAFLCPPMDISTKYEKLSAIPSNYVELTAETDGFSIGTDDIGNVFIEAKESIAVAFGSKHSIRAYYLDSEDGLYHFVYGQNFISDSLHANSVRAYISFMDSRTRTVYSENGDAYGHIANCAPNGQGAPTDGVAYGNPIAVKVN